ncbi:MAG: lipoate--protein ligase family protein [Mesoaciditoga sp.]|uniref:lipoate--protein ligase family protein n=1 Tax=Athalassotoga sp. TaxID=2022597 RepID=UPI000CADFCB3|nr:MAG: lipoate--protein ligase family protein [Mesoaciditoga sp.]PMP79130.1 MAG: lipoate--protein ligase family protein [Mesoaciditoga sp.]HEU24586.1 lipoate--protein ligase family protein [Mesoaciditoga lauensis]
MIWQFVDSGVMDGFKNMAYDLALLDNVQDEPVLRFYGWNPPALSIGRFQRLDDLNVDFIKKMGFDLVRRPSGGRAVLHYDELTYSVILPAFMSNKGVLESYLEISKALLNGLKGLNLNCQISRDKRNYTRNSACFAVTSVYEISVDGKKLVGSAQVRRNGKILQHGSIPLKLHLKEYSNSFKNSEYLDKILEDSMTSIEEHVKITMDELKEAILAGFMETLEIEFIPLKIQVDFQKYLKEVKVWD